MMGHHDPPQASAPVKMRDRSVPRRASPSNVAARPYDHANGARML
jgi:hypothetical protein